MKSKIILQHSEKHRECSAEHRNSKLFWIIWYNLQTTNTEQESCLYRTQCWTTGKSKRVKKCMQTINTVRMSAVTVYLENKHSVLLVLYCM
jgi:hypothetical protein